MADEEFRIAHAAFLRSWIGEEFFARGQSEEDFEDMVSQLVNQGGPVTQMFRSFTLNMAGILISPRYALQVGRSLVSFQTSNHHLRAFHPSSA